MYYCRLYILKGKSLISRYDAKPTTYLRISCGDLMFDMKERTFQKENYNPEYYVCQ